MAKLKDPIALVAEGKLLGTVKVNDINEEFYSFLGVPYAKPPLNNLRFKVSKPSHSIVSKPNKFYY